jgi:hypothetical protein
MRGLAPISMQEVRGNSQSAIRPASELKRVRDVQERVLVTISRQVSQGAISLCEEVCRACYRTASVTLS